MELNMYTKSEFRAHDGVLIKTTYIKKMPKTICGNLTVVEYNINAIDLFKFKYSIGLSVLTHRKTVKSSKEEFDKKRQEALEYLSGL